MGRNIARTPSIRDYSSVKGKRRLEILGFILTGLLIVVGTVSFLISERWHSLYSRSCTSSSSEYMVNITGSRLLNESPSWNRSLVSTDGIVYPPGSYWTSHTGITWGCPCMVKHCLNKCCKEEESHVIKEVVFTSSDGSNETYKQKECKMNHDLSFDQRNLLVHSFNNTELETISIKNSHFFIISGRNKERFLYDLDEEEIEKVFLLENGNLFWNVSMQPMWNYDKFCVETSNESPEIYFMIYFEDASEEEEKNAWMYIVKAAGMVISLPCLIITLLVYCLLPQLKNLHGKSLMCHVASLTVGYFCLAAPQILSFWFTIPRSCCTCIAFVIQFSLLASFFWLNVMCFDIWWVFSGLMPLRGSQQDAEQFKFLLYSLYAWGCPLLILAVTLAVEYSPDIPDVIIKPEMGITKCFFKENNAKLLYLYLPIGVLVYLNTIMFLTTSLRFKSHSRSVKKLERGDSRRHCQASKSTMESQRFRLYLKLSMVMGINWLLELLSFFVHSHSIFFLLLDLTNALRGVLIFYMFVCKRRILRLVNLKLCPHKEIISAETSLKTLSSGRSNSTVSRSTVQCKISNASEYQCSLAGGDSSA